MKVQNIDGSKVRKPGNGLKMPTVPQSTGGRKIKLKLRSTPGGSNRRSLEKAMSRGPAPGGSSRKSDLRPLKRGPAIGGERRHGKIVLKRTPAPGGSNRKYVHNPMQFGGIAKWKAEDRKDNPKNQKYEDKLAKIASLMIRL